MRDDKEIEQRNKTRKIVFLMGSSTILFLFAFSSGLFEDECETGLKQLYRLAESEGEYTSHFEDSYREYFEECKDKYTFTDQIKINQEINDIIRSERMELDV